MGYCMSQQETVFKIKRENHINALDAIKKLSGEETYGNRFSWVGDFSKTKTLSGALECWRWEPIQDEHYNIVDINFCGEKLGDDFTLFQAIAPYVESGSMIEMLGEDGAHWRWVFDGKTCKEQYAKLVWED